MLCFLARPTVADLLIGPELPFDGSAAINLSVLTAPPNDAFAVVHIERPYKVELVPIRDRQLAGDPIQIPCAGGAAASPFGALVWVRCNGGEVGVRFVSPSGFVSEMTPVSVKVGQLTPTNEKLFWTGTEFILVLTEDLQTLWYARFTADGSPIGVASILSDGVDFVRDSMLIRTSANPLLFVQRFSLNQGLYLGEVGIYVASPDGLKLVGKIASVDRLSFGVASDGGTQVFAAWAKVHVELVYAARMQLADLDQQGKPTLQRELNIGSEDYAPMSIAWDGAEFIVATPSACVATISSAAQDPLFVCPTSSASYAYLVSGNGSSAIIYQVRRNDVTDTVYRWITKPRHRAAR